MKWFISLLLLPHIWPDGFEAYWPASMPVCKVGRVVSALVIFTLYIYSRKLPGKPVWLLAGVSFPLILSTYVNAGPGLTAMLQGVSWVAVAMIVEFFSPSPKNLISGLMIAIEWQIYGNLLTVLASLPTGAPMNPYLLGHRNGFIRYGFLAIIVGYIYIVKFKKIFRPFCLIGVCYASIILTQSATSLVALSLVTVLMVLPSPKIRKKLTFPLVFVCGLCANLAVVIFRVMDRSGWIAWIIMQILKKQATLTGRTLVWDRTWELITENFIIGYGYGDHVLVPTVELFSLSAHNVYLELVLEGGIFALILFILLNMEVGKALVRHSGSQVDYMFLALLAGVYLVCITEAFMCTILVLIFMLAYHVGKLQSIPEAARKRRRLKVKW